MVGNETVKIGQSLEVESKKGHFVGFIAMFPTEWVFFSFSFLLSACISFAFFLVKVSSILKGVPTAVP